MLGEASPSFFVHDTQSPYGATTSMETGRDAIPLATTSSVDGPISWAAGTSKCVETMPVDATAMLL